MHTSQSNIPRLVSLSLVAAVFCAGFVGLGFWQLERAEEKEALRAQVELARQTPVSGAELFSNPASTAYYRRLELTGRFLSDPVLLLDNRIRDGRAGFEQLQFFRVEGADRLLLVNRGWVAAPAAAGAAEVVRIEAEVYPIPRPGLDLAAAQLPEARAGYWLLQRIDIEQLAAQFDRELRPELLRLLHGSGAGFDLRWPGLPMTAAKHRGYALQWFVMALAVGLLTGWLWWKRNEE